MTATEPTALVLPVWELVITGPPRTKKNHGSRIQRGRRRYNIPSHQWTSWVKTCEVRLVRADEYWPEWRKTLSWWTMVGHGKGDGLIHEAHRNYTDDTGRVVGIEHRDNKLRLNCRALIYRDADRGDANGYYQGIADLLEKLHVISNDRMIVSWNGSDLLKDPARPRVELRLETRSPISEAPKEITGS